jgi:rubrerythrin
MFRAIMRRSFAALGAVALGAGVGWVSTTNNTLAAGSTREKTIQNLQIAYESECNTEARYQAFAQKADAEGYRQVASLFRAAAKAEAVHAENHAMAIRGMGGEPKAGLKAPEVKSTRENLESAIASENYDCETFYPGFIQQAKETANTRVVRSLSLAKLAEVEHAKLYREALDNLESWKSGKRAFYVCEVCGFTASSVKGLDACSACGALPEMFVEVK